MDNFEPWEPFGSLTSSPAPKVPRRDSLAARDTNGQICQTALYSFSQGFAMFERSGPPKSERDCGNLHILPIGSISVKCTVSIRHGRNIGSLGANPTWTHLAQLGSKMAQLGSNLMGDIAGPIRNPQNAIFTSKAFFSINDASFEAMFPMLCLCWARSWSPKGPKLRHFWT